MSELDHDEIHGNSTILDISQLDYDEIDPKFEMRRTLFSYYSGKVIPRTARAKIAVKKELFYIKLSLSSLIKEVKQLT